MALTLLILVGLLVSAQPTAAVLTSVSGPDEVTNTESFAVEATVEVARPDQTDVEHFTLVLQTRAGESVTVRFDADGTVLDVDPPRGVVGTGEIRVNLLRRTLDIVPLGRDRDDRGFGYGDGERFAFRIHLDAKAFKPGQYSLEVAAVTASGRTFDSGVHEFEVVPAGLADVATDRRSVTR